MLDLSQKGLQIDGCLNLGQSGLQFVQTKSSGFPSTDVPSREADALIKFYNATDGDNWTTNTGWGTDPIVDNWYGVTVSGGHVTQIDLSANGSTLDGPGASYLSTLTNLTNIYLYDTGVTGDISGYSALTSLIILNLYDTGVTGDISGYSALTSLTYLHLGNTEVTGNVSGYSALTSLTGLTLGNTEVTGDVSGYSALTSLTTLFLYDIEVTGDISGYSALTSLTTLNLRKTEVTYTGTMSNWNNGSNFIYSLSWNETTVNAFLVDLDATDVEDGTLNIAGTNAAPGAAGLAAVTSLESKGWDITVTT